jgi:hypothetical protein
MNTSASGGYILPTGKPALPGNLNLTQFIQTVLVGISGLAGTLVVPMWQPEPPKQPDILTNWIGFGITNSVPDSNSFVGTQPDGSTIAQRHEALSISLKIFGPDALDIYTLIRDGFQIQDNLIALRSANMGFVAVDQAIHAPDFVNGRWINKYESVVDLRREIQRNYPILPILSATGQIHTVIGNEPYLLEWATAT